MNFWLQNSDLTYQKGFFNGLPMCAYLKMTIHEVHRDLMITIYLILLFIAPQLWLPPFIGLRTDLFLYPLWLAVLLFKGKLNRLWDFQSHDFVFLAMVVWIIISSLVNQSNQLTTEYVIDYTKYFLMYRLVIASIDDFSQVQRVINVVLALSYVLILESIQHKFSTNGLGWAGQPLGWADERLLQETGSGRTKWVGIFDGPGVFCVIFTIALPFVLQYFDEYYNFFKKIISFTMLVPLLVAIYFTGSRGGFIASIVIFFLYIIIKYKLSIMKIICGSIISALLLLVAPSYLTSTKDSNKSAQNRVEMWKNGVEMTIYNPVFGIGKGNFANYTGRLIAHNSAIEVMGETGLPGFFMWLTIIFLSLKSLFLFNKLSDGNPAQQNLSKALGVCIVGYIAGSMFVTLEYETFYFILAIAASIGRIGGVSVRCNMRDLIYIFICIFGWILLLKVFFMIY